MAFTLMAPELQGLIAYFVKENGNHRNNRGFGDETWVEVTPPCPRNRRDLCRMRLVSRQFCHLATPHLFAHVNVFYRQDQSMAQNMAWLGGLMALCSGPRRLAVRHLRVGFSMPDSHQPAELDGFVREMAHVLPIFMARLPRLETVVVRNAVGYVRRGDFGAGQWLLHMETARAVTEAVVRTLRYVPIPRLRRLSLWLPASMAELSLLTSDPQSPLQMPLEHMLRQLRCFDVRLYDLLSPPAVVNWDAVIDAAAVAMAALSVRNATVAGGRPLPAGAYAARMMRLIAAAPTQGMERLSIISAGPNTVDLAPLRYKPFGQLRSVRLDRVSLRQQTLMRMSAENPRLEHLELYIALLKDGKWTDVLLAMLHLDGLTYFRLMFCGYHANGDSSHWREDRAERNRDISSTSHFDLQALGCVQRMVNENRRRQRLRAVRESEYRHLHKPAPNLGPANPPSSPPFELPDGFDAEEWESNEAI